MFTKRVRQKKHQFKSWDLNLQSSALQTNALPMSYRHLRLAGQKSLEVYIPLIDLFSRANLPDPGLNAIF